MSINSREEQKICLNFLRGKCELNELLCPYFHPIKYKDNYVHWTIAFDENWNNLEIKANPIGFDKRNKQKIRREFFILMNNLSIYSPRIYSLRLHIYDCDYPHYEDPFYDVENYDKMLFLLKTFKDLKRLEFNIGSLYHLLYNSEALADLLLNLCNLESFTLNICDNDDKRCWIDYVYNKFLDILNAKKLKLLKFKISKPSLNDLLLINVLSESRAQIVKFEFEKIIIVKVINATEFYIPKNREIYFKVLSEAKDNWKFYSLGLMAQLEKQILKSPISLFHYNCLNSNYKEERRITNEEDSCWIDVLNVHKYIKCEGILINFDPHIHHSLDKHSKLKNLIRNKLIKMEKLKVISFTRTLNLLSVSKKTCFHLTNLININQNSLMFLTLNRMKINADWDYFSNLLNSLSKMKQLIGINIDFILQEINYIAHSQEISNKIFNILIENQYLIRFDLSLKFRDKIISALSNEHNFYLTKRKIMVYLLALLYSKNHKKYFRFRKNFLVELFLKILNGKKKESLPINLFQILEYQGQIPINPFDLNIELE